MHSYVVNSFFFSYVLHISLLSPDVVCVFYHICFFFVFLILILFVLEKDCDFLEICLQIVMFVPRTFLQRSLYI